MPQGIYSVVPGTCGVGVWYGYNQPMHWHAEIRNFWGGINYNIAGFVDTTQCKKVYNEIKNNHTIVFQSPIKRNRNSGRRFFFVVFKKGK